LSNLAHHIWNLLIAKASLQSFFVLRLPTKHAKKLNNVGKSLATEQYKKRGKKAWEDGFSFGFCF